MGSQPGKKQASSAVHQGVMSGKKGGDFLRSNLGLIESGAQNLAGMSSRSGVSRRAQVQGGWRTRMHRATQPHRDHGQVYI